MKSRSLAGFSVLLGVTFAAVLTLTPCRSASASPPPVEALSPAKKAILDACPTDTLNKKPCTDTRLAASTTCRDAHAHVHTNEWHHEVWLPYIRRLRGAYVGVGSDQGMTFIAAARAKIAWMIDYDPNVVRINQVHRILILASKDRKTYLARWDAAQKAATVALIAKQCGATPASCQHLGRAYVWTRKTISRYLHHMMRVGKHRRFHWLHRDADYAYIRAMFQAGRIRILGGDLLKARTLVGLGAAARRLHLPIRVLYLSNAEEYWRYPKQFRANIKALFFDAKSVVLRTRTSKKGPSLGRYQYIIQSALDFQRRIGNRHISGVWSMIRQRRSAKPKGLFTVGLPSSSFKEAGQN